MRRQILLAALFSFFSVLDLPAQTDLPDFGFYSNEELTMKECALDKEAEAVILLDEAFSYYDDEYQLITERRVRLKILNQRGIDRGAIKIAFYSKGDFEIIKKVEGLTYNATDNIPESKLGKKSIYTEKEDGWFSNVKFAMPNVKTGSIIEYKYTSVMKNYGGLDKWLFQSDVPTLRSCYRLQVLPNSEFSYLLTKKTNYAIKIDPPRDNGIIYFEMDNIPGLSSEPFMDAPKDYLQKVQFKLSSYRNQFGDKKQVNDTWNAVANDLLTEEAFGGAIKKNLAVPDELKAMVAAETSNSGKIAVIYNYVRKNYSWNGYYTKYASDGLKKIWDSHTGAAGDLNLLLINLLRMFKLDASPLLVAERNFGKVYPDYVSVDQFSKTVASVNAEGKILILDATQKYCPPGLTPYPLLNTTSLLVERKTNKLSDINSGGETYNNSIKITSVLGKDGMLKGSCVINSFDYARESKIGKIRDNKHSFISEEYEKPYEGVKVDSLSYDYPDNDLGPLLQHFNFVDQLNETGSFILFNYNLFTGLAKSPFTATERFTNINFGYPYQVVVEESIELPAGSRTDDMLKNKTLETPDKDISLVRVVSRTGNTISVSITFKQTVTLVAAESYPGLKAFYKMMIDMLNEPLVIKMPG